MLICRARWASIMIVSIGLIAPPFAGADAWDRVVELRPGTKVRVQVADIDNTIHGSVVAATPDAVTVSSNGKIETLARGRITSVDYERTFARSSPWIGMAIGAVWAGSWAAREPNDFNAFGKAMWTGNRSRYRHWRWGCAPSRYTVRSSVRHFAETTAVAHRFPRFEPVSPRAVG